MDRRLFLHSTAAASALGVLHPVFAAGTVKVAVMIPQSGPAGLFGSSAKACAELAAETINASGDLLGQKIELLFGDAGLAPAEASQAALKLWKGSGAAAVVGMHDSAVRGALVGLFKGQVPYFYTPVYEGGECAKVTYVNGETPQQQLQPVIPWIAAERKPKKWYMIGNDYLWGRNTNAAAKGYIEKTGAQVVGDEYLPFTVDNFDASLARIRDRGADAVLVSLVGGASVGFNKAFASFGLAEKALRLGTLIEENTLSGIGLANAKNLYSSAGFAVDAGRADRRRAAREHRPHGAPGCRGKVCRTLFHHRRAEPDVHRAGRRRRDRARPRRIRTGGPFRGTGPRCARTTPSGLAAASVALALRHGLDDRLRSPLAVLPRQRATQSVAKHRWRIAVGRDGIAGDCRDTRHGARHLPNVIHYRLSSAQATEPAAAQAAA